MTDQPTSSAPPKANKAALGLIFLTVFIDLLGFGIVLPLLPRYGDYFRADGLTLGLLMASFSAMQFLFAPLWGRLSDRIGRRPVLLIGLAGSVLCYGLFGLTSSIPAESTWLGLSALSWFFISRIGAGIAGATISTAQAYIADVTDSKSRGKGMALIGAAFGAGFTFGPLIAAPFAASTVDAGPSPMPGYLASGLSAVAFALALFKLPEALSEGSRSAAKAPWWNLSRYGIAFRIPIVGSTLLSLFLAVLAFAQLEATLSLLTKTFNYSDRGNFLVFAFIGFVLSISQGVLVRRMLPRIGNRNGATIGLVLITAGLLATGYVAISETEWLLLPVLALSVIGFSVINPSLYALLSLNTPATEQGENLGIGQSVAALARIIGPAIGITIYKDVDHGLPFWSGAACCGLCLVLFLVMKTTPDDANPLADAEPTHDPQTLPEVATATDS